MTTTDTEQSNNDPEFANKATLQKHLIELVAKVETGPKQWTNLADKAFLLETWQNELQAITTAIKELQPPQTTKDNVKHEQDQNTQQ